MIIFTEQKREENKPVNQRKLKGLICARRVCIFSRNVHDKAVSSLALWSCWSSFYHPFLAQNAHLYASWRVRTRARDVAEIDK